MSTAAQILKAGRSKSVTLRPEGMQSNDTEEYFIERRMLAMAMRAKIENVVAKDYITITYVPNARTSEYWKLTYDGQNLKIRCYRFSMAATRKIRAWVPGYIAGL